MTEVQLIKYLLKETSPEETRQIDLWVSENKENQKQFDGIRFLWNKSKNLQTSATIDTEEAWQRFLVFKENRKIDGGTNRQGKLFSLRSHFLRVAAAAFVIVGLSVFAYITFRSSKEIFYSHDKTRVETLPDRSVVTLNKNSSLKLEPSFNEQTRRVTLTGEAFFKVAPDKNKPFEVLIDQVKVLVVGTSFNIRSDNSDVEIIVETGIVKVLRGGDSLRLLPHQKVLIRKNEKMMSVESNNDLLYQYYRTNEIVCNHTPLYKLVDALNITFDAHIEIGDKEAGQMKITSRFQKKDLSEILNVISKTLGLRIEKSENKTVIYAR